jgi:hypothetical protein
MKKDQRKNILLLCTNDNIKRERYGLVESLVKRSNVVTLDRYRNTIDSIKEYIEKNKGFDLILYPDIDRAYLPEGINELKVPTACMQIDAYSEPKIRARMSCFFDLTLLFHPFFMDTYERYHPNVKIFPHAIPQSAYQKEYSSTRYDVSMIGRLDGADYSYRRSAADDLRSMDIKTNNMEEYYPYEDMVEVYGKSKISVNVSRGNYLDLAHLSCIEILGSGTLLLTTYNPDKHEGHELEALGFEEGLHFATFKNTEDMRQKISYYLNHEDERRAMAQRAREKTLKAHTYAQRADQLLQSLNKGISRQAPARSMPGEEVASIYVDYFSKRGKIDKTLHHLRRQREAGSAQWSLLRSMGQAAKATVRGWQHALTS